MEAILRADLHIHSTASDGLFSPSDIVRLAYAKGLDVIALCDHDSIDGIPVARATAEYQPVKIVPSLELSASFLDFDVHILGFWVDTASKTLMEALRELQEERKLRIASMVHSLRKDGFDITHKDVASLAGGSSPSRAHLARLLVENGHARTAKEAFGKYLEDSSPYFVPRMKLDLEDGVSLIKEAGGFPFVAHPGLSGVLPYLKELSEAGCVGFEAFHPSHTEIQKLEILDFAVVNGLHVSGGTDWHGDKTHEIDLGASMLPEPYLSQFLELEPK